MNKYIVSLFVVWVLLLPLGLQAQTAKWVIAPKYSSIVFYGKGLYKVKTGRHVGILDDKGNVIVPVNADSITAMTEACALVLQYEEEKYRLKVVCRGLPLLFGREIARLQQKRQVWVCRD